MNERVTTVGDCPKCNKEHCLDTYDRGWHFACGCGVILYWSKEDPPELCLSERDIAEQEKEWASVFKPVEITEADVRALDRIPRRFE